MGSLVRLRPVTEADLPAYVRWFNDPEMVGLPITEVKEGTATTEWVWLHSKLADPTERLWSMEVDGRLIGNCALHLRGEQGAELGILIGEKDAWGRGYGTDTVRQLLAIAFGELGLWRVWLRTRGVGVRPAWQRQGIAGALLAELGRRLLAQGCRFASLMFFEDNEAAKALYGKAGYDFWPGACVAGKTLAEE